MDTPTAMYHKDHPDGKVFDAREVPELILQGWVDTPAKLALEPVLEIQEEKKTEEKKEGRASRRGK